MTLTSLNTQTYLQQGYFNTQVNEVQQQLLQEVLIPGFYISGKGTCDFSSFFH